MRKFINRAGETYGRLSVLNHCGVDKHKQHLWNCLCTCGNFKVVTSSNLSNGKTKSCGCLFKELRKVKHGKRGTAIYSRWSAMKSRCYNENQPYFYNYGGRGIAVCEEWLFFENFYKDMQEGFREDLDIDRVDVNLGYFKGNCRWVTRAESNYNKNIQNNNTSGKTGVSYSKKKNKWVAYISVNNIQISLGAHDDYLTAVKARELAEIKYYGYIKK